MLKDDRIGIIDTIIHELFHRTVWIKGSIEFNESAANIIGNVGAIHYFEEIGDSASRNDAEARRYDQILFSKTLSVFAEELERAFASAKADPSKLEGLRAKVYQQARDAWLRGARKTNLFANAFAVPNNAWFVAVRTYFEKLDCFEKLYQLCGGSFSNLVAALRRLSIEIDRENSEPFPKLQTYINSSNTAICVQNKT